MKNKLILSLAASTLLLAGCAEVSTTVPDSSEVLMKVGNTEITKGEEYQLIKRVNGPSLTIQGVQKMIYAKEAGDEEENMKEAEELFKSYGVDEKTFTEQVKSYGYSSIDEYIKNVILPSVQAQKVQDKYFKENGAAIQEEFKPVIAAVIECDSEDNAQKAIDAMKDGTSPADAGKEYAREGANFTGKEEVISTQTTTLPTRLLNTLNETSKDGVLDEIFTDDTSTDDKAYYAVKLISRDYDANVDKIAEALGSVQSIATDCAVYYLDKYDFEVHDQYIFDYLKANNPEYLVTHPELAEDSSK